LNRFFVSIVSRLSGTGKAVPVARVHAADWIKAAAD
jgi:hypothetical protein